MYAGHEYVWVEESYGYTPPATMPASDLTFTAKWTGVSVTVKFDGGGGLIKDPHGDFVPSYFVTGTVEDTLTFPPESKAEGYTGHAWVDEADPTGTHITVFLTNFPLVDTTYKLIWDINKHAVTFNANNGKVVDPATLDEVSYYTVKDVEYGSDVEYPDAPVRELQQVRVEQFEEDDDIALGDPRNPPIDPMDTVPRLREQLGEQGHVRGQTHPVVPADQGDTQRHGASHSRPMA